MGMRIRLSISKGLKNKKKAICPAALNFSTFFALRALCLAIGPRIERDLLRNGIFTIRGRFFMEEKESTEGMRKFGRARVKRDAQGLSLELSGIRTVMT